MFNEGFKDEWEMHPYGAAEFHDFFDQVKVVLEPWQMLIGEVEGQPAGFCLGLPNWTPLFRSFKGRMGPVQVLRMLVKGRRYQEAGLIAIGVLPEFRGKGVAQKMAATLYSRYERKGLGSAFYYVVNDSNTGSRRLAESFGARGAVTYHCFDKDLV